MSVGTVCLFWMTSGWCAGDKGDWIVENRIGGDQYPWIVILCLTWLLYSVDRLSEGDERIILEKAVDERGRLQSLTTSIEVKDISLTDYINVNHAVYVREYWMISPTILSLPGRSHRLLGTVLTCSPHRWPICQEAVRQGPNAHC